jgi:RNA polymerase sigma factor (sigma-70 family)
VHEPDTNDLLAQYARNQSEAAFSELVSRHVNLVYSVALRRSGNVHQAEEITHTVFLILAKKAGSLSSKIILSGWLYRTAQLTASNYLRMENRRQRREQEAQLLSLDNESESDVWAQVAPMLETAMEHLGDSERNAVILRFFESKSLKEVGRALGTKEAAAQKRIDRALKKLRSFFTRRGVTLTATTLAVVLSSQSVQAAPASLASAIVTAGASQGAVIGGSPVILMKSTLKLMTWMKIKTTIVACVAILVIAGTTVLTVKNIEKAGPGGPTSVTDNRDIAAMDQANQAIQANPQDAEAYIRRGKIYVSMREYDNAIADFSHALQLAPQNIRAYDGRARTYELKTDYPSAIADYESALKVDPNSYLPNNNLSWLLATCPEASFRDGKKAVEYATRACEVTNWGVNAMDGLAAACAEAGDFENAMKWEKKVLEDPALDQQDISDAQHRLSLYEANQPYREYPR